MLKQVYTGAVEMVAPDVAGRSETVAVVDDACASVVRS